MSAIKHAKPATTELRTLAATSKPSAVAWATAELAGLTALHLDKGPDVIAEITGQPMERLNVLPPTVVGNDAG